MRLPIKHGRAHALPSYSVSIAIIGNRSFEKWGEILGDVMAAAALIDRLVYHATMITLKGNSYRLRERGQGVVSAAQAPSLHDSA